MPPVRGDEDETRHFLAALREIIRKRLLECFPSDVGGFGEMMGEVECQVMREIPIADLDRRVFDLCQEKWRANGYDSRKFLSKSEES